MRHRVEELHAQGLGYVAIGREVGISATSVRRLLVPGYAEHLRKLSREAKRRRTGICRLCGGKTALGKGREPATICGACAHDHYGALQRAALIGRGPVTERCRELLAAGPMRRGELRDALEITDGHVSVLLNRLLRQGYVERVGRGLYQLCTTKPAPVSAADPSPHKERAQSVA